MFHFALFAHALPVVARARRAVDTKGLLLLAPGLETQAHS